MSYNIKLYRSTGFNAVNVPDCPELLDNGDFEYDEFENVNLVQGRYLTQVTLTMTADEANSIDFVKLSNEETDDVTCYIVDHYEMQSENICKFYLLLEPYTTMGGLKLNGPNEVVGGNAIRCHVSVDDDNKNFYTNDEPFQPQRNCKWTIYKLLDLGNDTYTIMETLSIPSKTVLTTSKSSFADMEGIGIEGNCGAYSMGAATGDEAVYFKDTTNKITTYQYNYAVQPMARNMDSTTIKTSNGDIDTGTRWWYEEDRTANTITIKDGKKEIKYTGEVGAALVSDGRPGDINAYWQVPKIFIDEGKNSHFKYSPTAELGYGGIDTIGAKQYDVSVSTGPSVQFNKKLNYGQNKIIRIYNPVSGDSSEKQIYEVKSPSSTPETVGNIEGTIIADIRPTGQPIFMFKWLNDSDNDGNAMESVQGGNWRQLNLNISGVANGQTLANVEQRQLKENTEAQNLMTGFNGALSAIGNLISGIATANVSNMANGVSSIVNTGYDIWKNNKAVQDQNEILNTQAATAATNITASNSNFFCDTGKNTFFAVVSEYTSDDAILFDAFLTQYGYNLGSHWLTQIDFNNRPSYNFVQVSEILIRSNTASQNLLQDVEERLKTGLRIWHKKPTLEDFGSQANR